ncbi:hypothetical protein HYH02_010146 [Chlamydomonas schloesseri]|uniref:Nephrocystin 3-like N-terminal domain-containing protein n=1 Tax=Chlamydomonas schloesseri TaxID=2026947 RepID=A0A835W4R9_9CHLO|nr:hypothetical protein HYH02_010146 [Chlamydomonas schloesseri]|eukprot:KAG2440562.1 hypothetical protein HYH02_010146 [Chlamydomonas schloesseri]
MGCGVSKNAQALLPPRLGQQGETARVPSSTVGGTTTSEREDAAHAIAVATNTETPANSIPVPAITAGGIAIKQSRFEEGMCQHGAAVLGVLAAGVGCIPDPLGISSAVSNVLGIMQQRVEGAANNTDNCRKLLEAAQWSQRCLEEMRAALPPERLAKEAAGTALQEQLQELERALQDASTFTAGFGEKTFLAKLISVGGDKDDFELHHHAITQATERLMFKLALKAASTPPPTPRYEEESEKLRAVICEMGGSNDFTAALMEVKKQGLLGSAQLKARLSAPQQVTLHLVEARLEEVLTEVQRVRLPLMLPPGLQQFWHYYFNAESVAFENFFRAVTVVIQDQVATLVGDIKERARQLVRDSKAELKASMPSDVPPAPAAPTTNISHTADATLSSSTAVAGGAADSEALDEHMQVLRALIKASLDVDHNGQIHMDEYNQLYMTCCEWACLERVPQPQELPACISMLCRHWEPAQLLAAEQEQLRQLEAVLRPINFAKDVSNLLSRFLPDSRQWIFEAFAEWMAIGAQQGAVGGCAAAGGDGELARRAMVLYGGPGLGKSTIAAALVCKRVFRQVDAMDGPGTTEPLVESSAVVGHYFCKHNDVVRSDPLLMMRTLAFQLAERIPELRPFMLTPYNGGAEGAISGAGAAGGLLAGAAGSLLGQRQQLQWQQVTREVLLERAAWVDSLRTVEEAFEKLLLQPLIQIKDVLARRAEPLVIVIDGLDEVVLDGAASGGGGADGDGGGRGRPVGRQSPLLRVVCDQFKKLPEGVRFFITSRPEAHIKRALDKAFSKPLTIWPDDPRHQDDLRRMIHKHIKDKLMSSAAAAEAAQVQRGRSTAARAAGAAHQKQSSEVAAVRARLLVHKGVRGRLVPPSSKNMQQRNAADVWPKGRTPVHGGGGGEAPTADAEADEEEDNWHASESEVAAAVDLLVKKSEGAFVYVARLLDGLYAKPRWTLAELTAFPQGLYGTYEEFVSKHVGYGGSAAFRRVRRMLSVLMAAQEPLQLSTLTYAWRASWNGGGALCPPCMPSAGGGGGGRGSGGTDDGSGSSPSGDMPYQDALDDVNGMLRMLGSLYTLRGSRIMVFHKSFHDWLATRYISSAGAVDGAGGGAQQREDERERNPYYVDPQPGHAALATAMLPVASAKAGASMSPPLRPPADGVLSTQDPAGGLSSDGEDEDDEDYDEDEEDEEGGDRNAGKLIMPRPRGHAGNFGGSGGARLAAGAMARPGFRLGSIGGRDTDDIKFLPAPRHRGVNPRKARLAEQLRQQLAEEQAQVRAYSCKFVMRHVAEVAAAATTGGGAADVAERCARAVDALLRDFSYLGLVFAARHGHTLIGNLLALPARCRSAWADDALRWMLVCQDSLFGAHSEAAVVAAALRCPVGTQVFALAQERQMLQAKAAAEAAAAAAAAAEREEKERKEAARGGRGPARGAWGSMGAAEGAAGATAARQYWRLQRLLGGNTDWPAFILVMAGHAAHVASCSWSPNSKWLASGSWDRTVRVWDAASSACHATLQGHTGDVTSVQWCPVRAGKLGKLGKVAGIPLASASQDGSLRVWDVTTGECVKQLQGHDGSVLSLSWSPDGSKLASGGLDTTVKVWEAAEGTCLLTLEGHNDRVCSVAWSPDGTGLVSGGWDGGLRLWSVASSEDAKCTCVFKVKVEGKQQEQPARIFGVAWSPDGKALAATYEDAVVRLWPARAGGGGAECIAMFEGHTAPVKAVAWSPNSKLLVSAGWDGSIRLWDAMSGGLVATLDGSKEGIFGVAWSPNGRWLASASGDRLLRLWDAARAAASGGRLDQQEHLEQVRHVSWSPDGRRVASCSWQGCVQVWRLEPEGAPACGGAITSGECSALLEGHTAVVMAVAWNPSASQLLATASRDHTVKVWDISGTAAMCKHTLKDHASIVTCLAWSGDGSKLASGSGDTTVQIWSIDRTGGVAGQKAVSVLKGHSALVRAVAWAPNGQQLASGAWDSCVRVWDTSTGTCLMVIKSHADRIMALSWSPDGTMLASSSGRGQSIKQSLVVLEMSSMSSRQEPEQLCILQGHTDVVTHMSWSPDSSHLATSSWDGDVRLWRPRSSAASVGALEGHTGVVAAVQWSGDGRRLASGSWDRSLRVWELVEF